MAEQSRAEQSRAEQSRAEQSRAEQSRAEQSRAEQSRAEQSRAERNTNPIHSLIHSLTHSLTHPHPPTHPPTHSLTHSLILDVCLYSKENISQQYRWKVSRRLVHNRGGVRGAELSYNCGGAGGGFFPSSKMSGS